MLGVDPYWERIHLAYHFEVEKRTKQGSAPADVFEPGEIAHIDDDGTLTAGFYDFLEWQGLRLTHREKTLQKKIKRDGKGRYCLVVQRLDDGRYIICYLASFHQAVYAENIQNSLSRLFAIAIDDTPEYPPGTPSIKVAPKWTGQGFLYAIPVPRYSLVRNTTVKNKRFILRMGELERVKRLIVERVKAFRANHTEIRKEELRWRKAVYDSGHFKHPSEASDAQKAADEVADDAANEVPTALAASADDSEAVALEERSTITRPITRRGPAPRLPRIHFLEASTHWLNVHWLLMTMRFDVMHSSRYLNSIDLGRGLRKAASKWKRLPIC